MNGSLHCVSLCVGTAYSPRSGEKRCEKCGLAASQKLVMSKKIIWTLYIKVGPWHPSEEDNPTSKHHMLWNYANGPQGSLDHSAGMRRPSVGSGLDRNRIREKNQSGISGLMKMQERIWVVSPSDRSAYPPWEWQERSIRSFIFCALYHGAAWLGFRRPLLINFFLMVPGLLKLWPWRSVYYLVDRWDAPVQVLEIAMMSR